MTDHFDPSFDDDQPRHDDPAGTDAGPVEAHGWVDDWVDAWDEPDELAEPDPASEVGDDIPPEAEPHGDRADVPRDGPIDLSFDDEPGAFPDEPSPDDGSPDDGTMAGDALRDALVAAGVPEAADALDGVDVVEPRRAASVLDGAGLQGWVEHSDIGAVVEAVQEGHDVVLVGSRSFTAVDVDVAGDALVLESVGDGERIVVSLRDFADAWALLDHEALFVPASTSGPVRVGGDTWVVAIDPSGLEDPVVAR